MLAIVSAIQDEISTIIELLKAEKQADVDIWYSQKYKTYILPLGVGFLTAAIHLQYFCNQHPEIKEVLFCGTAGSYQDEKLIGSITSCSSTILGDAAAEIKLSLYAPILERESLEPDFKIDLDLNSGKVLTALTLTKDDNTAVSMAEQTGADFENMELYGIASVCRLMHIRWNSILGITNAVGKNGHVEWYKNHKAIEARMGVLVSDLVKNRK